MVDVLISAFLQSECMNSGQKSEEQCLKWKNRGLCKSDKLGQFMLDHCNKTCGCVCSSNTNIRSNVFTYSDQSHLIYTNWAIDEKNNINCQEDCAIMKLNNAQWNDEDCRKKHGFICQSEKRSDQMIQFRHKEFVALKNELFVEIIVDRLFMSSTEATVEWEVEHQTGDCSQDIVLCNGTISFSSGESTTKLEIPIANGNEFNERKFQIHLIAPQNPNTNVKLGNINKTLVRIISNLEAKKSKVDAGGQ